MRRFSFASGYFRNNIDLQKYESIIINAVHEVIPNAKVTVFHDSYVIDKVTKGESIKIGRKLASTQLCAYCIKISKLFSGEEIDDIDLELLERLEQTEQTT